MAPSWALSTAPPPTSQDYTPDTELSELLHIYERLILHQLVHFQLLINAYMWTLEK